MIDPKTIDSFHRDGVVHLKQQFSLHWINVLGNAINASFDLPSPSLHNHSLDPSKPAYYEDFWSWSRFEGFQDFIFNSPAAPLAAELMDAARINLVMDNWFMREAGSTSMAPFHHDISYFDFTGTMCVLWLPLEPVKKENSLCWVRGSHLWDKLFMRVFFNDGHEPGGAPGIVNGQKYDLPPDINGNPDQYDLLRFDLEPGDCVFFDMRTLHGSLKSVTTTEPGRRYTLRMTAEDGMIRYRGDWAKGERAMMETAGYRDGDPLEGSFFPQLWPRVEDGTPA